MGVDISYLSKKTIEARINGSAIVVGEYKYMSRYNDYMDALDGYAYGAEERKRLAMFKARIARVEQGWESVSMPLYVVTTGFKEESVVYVRDSAKADTFWVDTQDPGEEVGMLKKVGREWRVVPVYKCWHCKDTGVAKYRMSQASKMWVEGMVCSCNPAGDEAAKVRYTREEQERNARNDRLVWERSLAIAQKHSLDSCCL